MHLIIKTYKRNYLFLDIEKVFNNIFIKYIYIRRRNIFFSQKKIKKIGKFIIDLQIINIFFYVKIRNKISSIKYKTKVPQKNVSIYLSIYIYICTSDSLEELKNSMLIFANDTNL